MAYKKDKRENQDVAFERIIRLLNLAAAESFAGEAELAKSHVKLARAVGTRYNVRMPKEFKGKFCKGCSTYLTPADSRTRINSKEKKIELTCLSCGRVMKVGYK